MSWILILGYILTLSVYAFTFGHYVANVVNLGDWLPHVLAFAIIFGLTLINFRGVGDSSNVEIITGEDSSFFTDSFKKIQFHQVLFGESLS